IPPHSRYQYDTTLENGYTYHRYVAHLLSAFDADEYHPTSLKLTVFHGPLGSRSAGFDPLQTVKVTPPCQPDWNGESAPNFQQSPLSPPTGWCLWPPSHVENRSHILSQQSVPVGSGLSVSAVAHHKSRVFLHLEYAGYCHPPRHPAFRFRCGYWQRCLASSPHGCHGGIHKS